MKELWALRLLLWRVAACIANAMYRRFTLRVSIYKQSGELTMTLLGRCPERLMLALTHANRVACRLVA